MSFAERLKLLREEMNLNQNELAKMLNISRQSISNYENGARFPSDEKFLLKVARFFNVSIDYLLGATNMRIFYSTSEAASKNVNIKESNNCYTASKNEALENLFHEIDELPAEVIEKITSAIKLFTN